jgi:hypothetical protein
MTPPGGSVEPNGTSGTGIPAVSNLPTIDLEGNLAEVEKSAKAMLESAEESRKVARKVLAACEDLRKLRAKAEASAT